MPRSSRPRRRPSELDRIVDIFTLDDSRRAGAGPGRAEPSAGAQADRHQGAAAAGQDRRQILSQPGQCRHRPGLVRVLSQAKALQKNTTRAPRAPVFLCKSMELEPLQAAITSGQRGECPNYPTPAKNRLSCEIRFFLADRTPGNWATKKADPRGPAFFIDDTSLKPCGAGRPRCR